MRKYYRELLESWTATIYGNFFVMLWMGDNKVST